MSRSFFRLLRRLRAFANCGLVSNEARASYTIIIDDILRAADLTTISAKSIRKGLQARVEKDLTPLKVDRGSILLTESRY
jgi:hypothetical protein